MVITLVNLMTQLLTQVSRRLAEMTLEHTGAPQGPYWVSRICFGRVCDWWRGHIWTGAGMVIHTHTHTHRVKLCRMQLLVQIPLPSPFGSPSVCLFFMTTRQMLNIIKSQAAFLFCLNVNAC